MKKFLALCLVVVCLAAAAGCASRGDETPAKTKNKEERIEDALRPSKSGGPYGGGGVSHPSKRR